MEDITNFNSEGRIASVTYLTDDYSKVNLLKRAILSEIETYCIDIVIFQTNTSSRHDEIISLRLGQLIIDNERFAPPEEGDLKVHIDVKGPKEFTTSDIPDLPFTDETPIAALREGQRIICDVIVKLGTGKQHVKWRPVSKVVFSKIDEGFKVTIKTIGMLSGEKIFERGYSKMREAATRPSITLFSHVVVPSEFQ